MNNRGKKTTADSDEVEQLLRAAQDDVLLKLSLNSHTTRGGASAAIDPDLDRRFQALRKPQNPRKIGDSNPRKLVNSTVTNNKVDGDDADDLFARFAALKKSNVTNVPSDVSICNPKQLAGEEEDEESEEDEVEKVMKWAIDAARLDPSPQSDDDDDDNDDDSVTDEDEDDDDGIGKKGKRK